jgi:membrane-bound ClpP family serine protease
MKDRDGVITIRLIHELSPDSARMLADLFGHRVKHLEDLIMQEWEDLKAKATAIENVEDSAKAVIDGINQRIQDALNAAAGDSVPKAEVQAVLDELTAHTDPLVSSITASTTTSTSAPAPAPADPGPAP